MAWGQEHFVTAWLDLYLVGRVHIQATAGPGSAADARVGCQEGPVQVGRLDCQCGFLPVGCHCQHTQGQGYE